jgi:hypothetical protein
LSQIVGNGLHYLEEGAVFDPALESAMAGLVWREGLRHLVPLGSGVQYPQDSIEDGTCVLPGAAPPAAVFELFSGEMPDDPLPLLVGERHSNGRS